MAAANPVSCENIRIFKESLKDLRLLDDKIIYKLNVSVPTESFQHKVDAEDKCKTLYNQLLGIYKIRENAIKNCISIKSKLIEELKVKTENDENPSLLKELRSQQSSLRLIRSELMVEEVIKSRSVKVFKERCWKAYSPPDS